MIKRAFLLFITLCIVTLSSCGRRQNPSGKTEPIATGTSEAAGMNIGGMDVYFTTENKTFQRLYRNGSRTETYIKGVNMGLTEATTSLRNPDVSYETYLEWFGMISDMNANTIRVYTVMPPQFYKALRDYNEGKMSPLYLIHGIWFNEDYMYSIADAYNGDTIYKAFVRAAEETADIVHGNSDYTSYGEIEKAVYEYDVSPYLTGYVLGLEWDPDFVANTNAHTDRASFNGKYLYTSEKATSFEAFLCSVGEALIQFESQKYKMQAPVAFLNWATTDTITHSNEPFDEEDAESVNTENILPTSQYKAGLFAAVDAYPYYPEFMNHQEEYISFIDPDTGKMNPYRAYIRDLHQQYSVPLIIAEVGLPTSRGIAHASAMGYDQGGLTEEQQGQYVGKMIEDIHAEGCAGALIFSWQDEWFKQTWNTIKYAPDDAKMRTPNVQSAEQSYGILSMEPGIRSTSFCDGDFSEWAETDTACRQNNFTLSMKYDEAFLYLYIVPDKAYGFETDTLYVPIQTVGYGSKQYHEKNLSFSDAADFVLVINGAGNTRILCDAYYDSFYYVYSVMKRVFPVNNAFAVRGAGIYNPVRQFLSNEMKLPVTGEYIAPQYYESGLLKFGNNNPQSKSFDSQADFYGSDSGLEIRIPWYLLNVMNPCAGVAVGNLNDAEMITFTDFGRIRIGIGGQASASITLMDTAYKNIEEVKYHTRLKKSYDILKRVLGAL